MPRKVNRWRVFELLLHDHGFSLNVLHNYAAVLNILLSVNLVWHDLKLQRFSSTYRVEKPLGLMPTGNPSSRTNYSVLECYERE